VVGPGVVGPGVGEPLIRRIAPQPTHFPDPLGFRLRDATHVHVQKPLPLSPAPQSLQL
jgi:hypothetical protein